MRLSQIARLKLNFSTLLSIEEKAKNKCSAVLCNPKQTEQGGRLPDYREWH